jgi:hypothetical protein
MSQPDVAVFVCSSDSRRDVLDSVLPSLAKFWPDCPYPVYVGLNSPAVLLPGFMPVVAPASAWCRETCLQLQQTAADYLIVILDDFLIGAPVKQARVASLAVLAASRRLPYLRLLPLGRSLLERLSGGGESEAQITRIRVNHPFYAALQIAIWRKDHLLAMLAKGCTIWEFEHERIAERVHHAIVADPPIIYRHVVEKGRWLPDARFVFGRAGLVFRAGNRAVWSRWRYLRLMIERIRWLLLGYSTC